MSNCHPSTLIDRYLLGVCTMDKDNNLTQKWVNSDLAKLGRDQPDFRACTLRLSKEGDHWPGQTQLSTSSTDCAI